MSAVVSLGLRLARAGGVVRAGSIVVGNAVGTVLVLMASVLPGAIQVDAVDQGADAGAVTAICLFLVAPAVVLLVTVGRLSSGVRDRRLAALRMIGVSPARTRRLAVVENGSLALVGAVAGAVAAWLAVPWVGGAVVDRVALVVRPPVVSGTTAVVAALAVTVLSVVVGTSATWNRELPGRARSEAVRRTPRPWRIGVLLVGVGMLAAMPAAAEEPGGVPPELLLLGGGVVAGLGVVLTPPLVTAWVARVLVRSRRVVPLLAGRAIETDSVGASRIVAGLGVAVFLTAGALGVIAAFESTPQYRYAAQTIEGGPQQIWVDADEGTTAEEISVEAMDAIAEVPGVAGVVPGRGGLSTAPCPDAGPPPPGGCQNVFVGTCAELALVAEVSRCADGRAAWIVDTAGGPVQPVPDGSFDASAPIGVVERRASAEIELAPADPVVIDTEAHEARWVYPASAAAIVPPDQVADLLGPIARADVVADGGVGVQSAVVERADALGLRAMPYPTGDIDYVDRVRAAILSLAGIALGIGLLIVALTATDRAVERRRSVARQVMVGFPGRVLRGGQFLQVLVPASVAVLLGAGAGAVLARGYINVNDTLSLRASALAGQWEAFVAVVGVGVLVVALATVPLVRTRLTPDLLRRE